MALDPKVSMTRAMAQIHPGLRYQGGDINAWQIKGRNKLKKLIGYEGSKVDPNFRIEWVHKEDKFTETRFFFETEPDVTSVAHILIPHTIKEKTPIIICLQGHTTGMHISIGRAIYPGDANDIKDGDRDFALQIISRGQIALVLEQRGFGERGGSENGPACTLPAIQALLIGRTLIGQRCWDISRAIDVVEANFPQVDMNRIAIMGNSGGGTTTIYAAALDQRITAAMPSCALSGFHASIGVVQHCMCNYIPDILNHFDMGDLIALAAPIPYVVVNGTSDPIFPLDSANLQFDIACDVYNALGVRNNLRHVIGPKGHRFYANLSWPVFDDVTGWKK